MIISASRRTDIPAFFGDWFMNRIRGKEVLVRNPMNPNQISRIALDPEYVDCIVFWTKNVKNFMRHLDELERAGYRYYFQYTLNGYGKDIEKNIDAESAAEAFIALSKLIGKKRIIWRYDPIIINGKYGVKYHAENFKRLCAKLSGFTERCVISFVDGYGFLADAFREHNIGELTDSAMREIADGISGTAGENGISITSCCETIDLSEYNIGRGKCIDNELINKLFGLNIGYKKDTGQRRGCGCCVSRDIGAYNSCLHDCVYCYAKRGRRKSNCDPASPLLCDYVNGTGPVKCTT
ncbi:MAG: DUF1848 domain-containing protein [Spirochaetaceae bacterium]|jgi:hypothetical protein|nr:DUF1848 domain-containing protein [Spirochaetaceae bacterium]